MTAFIFVPLLAFTCIMAGVVWSYASHAFVVIVEDTAAGNEVLIWDDEPMFDWLWQGGYMAWHVGIWVVPAFLIARLATADMEGSSRWYAFASIGFAVFWAAFPISLLSSMAAESRLALVHFGLLRRLALRAGDVLIFYVLSALIVAACVPLAPWLFTGDGMIPFVVAPPLLALAFFFYARLMGRLACVARLTYIRPQKPKASKRMRPAKGVQVIDPWDVPEEVSREEEARGTGFVQPSDLPPVETPYEGEVTGYDVSFQDESVPVAARQQTQTDEGVPVRLDREVEERAEAMARRARRKAAEIEPDKLEMERLSRRQETMPAHPWADAAVWLFPMQPKSATQWGVLMLAIGFMAILVQGLQMFWPWQ